MAAAFNAEQLEQFVQSCTTTLAELRSASRPISATDDGFMHSLMCAWEISECSYDRLHSDARLRLERQHEHVDRLSRQLLQQLAAMQKQLQVLQKIVAMPAEALVEGVLPYLNYESLVALRMSNAKLKEVVATHSSKLARLQLKRITITDYHEPEADSDDTLVTLEFATGETWSIFEEETGHGCSDRLLSMLGWLEHATIATFDIERGHNVCWKIVAGMKCADVHIGRLVLPTKDARAFDAAVVKWLVFDVFERVDEVKKTSYRDTITEDPDFRHKCETRRIRIA